MNPKHLHSFLVDFDSHSEKVLDLVVLPLALELPNFVGVVVDCKSSVVADSSSVILNVFVQLLTLQATKIANN